MTSASSPSPSISAASARMLAAAMAWLSDARPMWWVSAPQQPTPLGITTSQPWRRSRRIVASLMSVFSAFCAQPVSSATRRRRGPSATNTCGRSLRLRAGNRGGAMSSIARSRASGTIRRNGRAIRAAPSASRNRPG